jgi:histone arginine demethylase JMJD6
VGSDDDGYAVRLKMHHFCDYVADPGPAGASVDDSPLYVFDGSFGDHDGSKAMLGDFCVPPYFARDDLFGLVGNKRRPPFRWVVFGPARSGSACHIDPLASAAWNALLSGRKRWCLLPPGVPRSAVKPAGVGLDGEAVTWFTRALPLCRAEDWPHARPVEAIQRAGEIMFVPHGWWHAVLNLDHTIAVTQNYISGANFDAAWRHTRKARPRLAGKWLERLRGARPDLAAVAERLAAEDAPVSESSPSSSSSSTSSDSSDEDADDTARADDAAAAAAPADEAPGAKRAHLDDGAAAEPFVGAHAERGAAWGRRRAAA